jgi:glycerate kinase
MSASSRGVGEVMVAAIESGCTRVILGIGGSASTDGGAGLVRALGGRLLDARGEEVAEGGAGLIAAESLEVTALYERMKGVEIIVACDVDNPLTGPAGAAATYGPQKGANPAEVEQLNTALTHWATLVAHTPPHASNATAPNSHDALGATGPDSGDALRATGRDSRDLRDVAGAGAAGGVGFAALALLGGELRPGIELVLELVGFAQRLSGVDLIVTGEGKLDEQTLRGKAVAGVAAAGRAAGVPVVAVCGTNTLEAKRLRQAGIGQAYALTDLQPDVRRCIADPVPLLQQLGERIAADLR